MPLRILIADDSTIVRKGIKDLLLSGHSGKWVICGEASDGNQAVAEANRLSPDVVLLDLSLPNLSGIQVAKSLRQSLPGSTIILISEQDPEILRQIAQSAALQYYLPKSNLGLELLPTLETIFGTRQ